LQKWPDFSLFFLLVKKVKLILQVFRV